MPRRKLGEAEDTRPSVYNVNVYAFKVVGEELARSVFDQVGKATKITFGQTGTEHTLTESRIENAALVDSIRRALDKKGRTQKGSRTLYFSKKFDGLDADPKEAIYLASKGFSVSEVADALGVTTQTVHRWGVRTPKPWFNPEDKFDETELKKLAKAGETWMKRVAPTRELSAFSDHPTKVGAARAYLRAYRKKNQEAA